MILTFHPAKGGHDNTRYPHGYWYAQTTNGDYDADGPTPLAAVCSLIAAMEEDTDGDR